MTASNQPRVGFLRPEATFTHLAAQQHFGPDAAYLPLETEPIFQAVQSGELDYGVLPIENLFEGTVGATMDLVIGTPEINVAAEIFLPIHHHLLSKGPLEAITRVYSHEQALSQCRSHLLRLQEELGHEVELVREASTAQGAQRAAEAAEPGAAALAPEIAATQYGLEIVRRNMEDGEDNVTRFWVLARGAMPEATGNDKTSFMFDVENQPGTLAQVLNIFSSRGLNATMLQSRPARLDRAAGLWEYTFFIEFLGHIRDPELAEAYRILDEGTERICKRIRLLGSYPRGAPF